MGSTIVRGRQTCRRIPVALLLVMVVCAGAASAYDNGSLDPADHRALGLWREGAGLHISGEYQAAIARYRRALQFHPTARTHTYLAWSLSRLGRYQEAVDNCREAIALDPGYANAYNDLGAYLIEMGRPAEAIPWLQEAVGLSGYCCPHYTYYQLGRALLAQARVEEAEQAFETALSIRPRYQPARALLQGIRSRGLKGL